MCAFVRQLLEKKQGGGSLLWFTVQMVTPGEAIHLIGQIGPDWGGPAVSMVKLSLKEDGEKTIFQLQDALIGCIPDNMVDNLEGGWKMLFANSRKPRI